MPDIRVYERVSHRNRDLASIASLIALFCGHAVERTILGRDSPYQRTRYSSNDALNPVVRRRAHHVETVCHLAAKRHHESIPCVIGDAAIEIEPEAERMGEFNAGPEQQAHRAGMRHLPVAGGKKVVDVFVIPDEEHLGVGNTVPVDRRDDLALPAGAGRSKGRRE